MWGRKSGLNAKQGRFVGWRGPIISLAEVSMWADLPVGREMRACVG